MWSNSATEPKYPLVSGKFVHCSPKSLMVCSALRSSYSTLKENIGRDLADDLDDKPSHCRTRLAFPLLRTFSLGDFSSPAVWLKRIASASSLAVIALQW